MVERSSDREHARQKKRERVRGDLPRCLRCKNAKLPVSQHQVGGRGEEVTMGVPLRDGTCKIMHHKPRRRVGIYIYTHAHIHGTYDFQSRCSVDYLGSDWWLD